MYTPRPWDVDPKKSLERFQIFEKLAPYNRNITWKNIFVDFASGNLPKYFKYDGTTLSYIRGEKIRTMEISSSVIPESTEERISLVQDVTLFLEDCYGINVRDDAEDSYVLDILSQSLEPVKWSDIRRQNVKEKYISDYVNTFAKSVGIKNSIVKYKIYEKLICAISQSWITSTDVIFSDGKIITINGVQYDPIKRDIIIDIVPKKSRSKSTIKKVSDSTVIKRKWEKYLISLKARFVKKSTTKSKNLQSVKTEY